MKKLTHDRTVVYNIGYHMVWSVKYRRTILKKEFAVSLKEIILKVAKEKGFVLKAIEVQPDHVHVFVSAKPKVSPSYIYKMLKGISGRLMFIQHPNIKKFLWNNNLWNPSTYVETVGHISEETVKKYIAGQKRK